MPLTANFRERYLTSQDGLRLYWRDYGDPLAPGVPLLCLTGLTRNSKDFDDLATRCCGFRRVICPDYRGRGRSEYDPNPRNYDPRVYLQDIRHVLAAAGIHRCIVVGTSLGGILAMALSVLMPSVVAGAVLNDIGPEVAQNGLGRIIDYIGKDQPQPDWHTAVTHLKQMLPNLTFQGADGWDKLTRNTFREDADGMLHFDWDVTLVEGLRRGAVPDLWPMFRALSRVPVLAVRGGRSDVLTATAFDRMAEEMPGLARVTVPDTGHCPALDEDVVLSAVDALIARVDGTAQAPTWEERPVAARKA